MTQYKTRCSCGGEAEYRINENEQEIVVIEIKCDKCQKQWNYTDKPKKLSDMFPL